MVAITPRRSVLFMPASNARALAKAKTLAADVLVFDLEDAVVPADKISARGQAAAAVRSGDYGTRELVIRINGMDTMWARDDIAAAGEAGATGVLVPKVNSVGDVMTALTALDDAGSSAKLWLMIETPLGILNAASIANASDRVAALVVGSNDLVSDMRAEHVPLRAPIQAALTMTVLAARAAGVAVIDAVYNAFKDEAGFWAESRQARAFGFDGKSLIHPNQIETANAVFAPNEQALELAQRQIEAFDTAVAEGKAVAVVDGRMVEELHSTEAHRLLAFDAAIKARAN